jgi:uncharacterized protein (DUF433 family)
MSAVVTSNPKVLGGTPVFTGTRVPVAALFDHIEAGYTIEFFLTQFPSVRRDQVREVLEEAKKRTEAASQLVTSK